MLDAKYEPADLQKTVSDSNQLSTQQALHVILNKQKTLFDGSLGTRKNEQIESRCNAISCTRFSNSQSL
jgi:hypothetical protein